MPPTKRTTSIKIIADELGLDPEVVRDVLREAPVKKVTREQRDLIFKAARSMGYDFGKLRIGKRLQYRKETLEELAGKIERHPEWGRTEILRFVQESCGFLDRVHGRAFKDEYGGRK